MQANRPSDNAIPNRWVPFIRVVWIVSALLPLSVFLFGLPLRYNELLQLCNGSDCPFLVLSPQEAVLLNASGLSQQEYAGFQIALELYLITIFATLAILIFWRKNTTWVAFLISLSLLFTGVNLFTEESRTLMLLYPSLQQPLNFLTSISVVLFMLFFYVFPDGRFVPHWLRYVAVAVSIILLLEPFLFRGNTPANSPSLISVIAGISGVMLGLFSQYHRYQHVSTPSQRQQTKWVLFGLVSMLAMVLVWVGFVKVASLPPGSARLAFNFSLLFQYLIIGLFPLTVFISIRRYGLWEIDRLISRTLTYALLTGLLGLFYFVSVLLLQQLLDSFLSHESPLVMVASTLVIAALFNPLRKRLQRFVDGRFYRKKYNAQQVLAQFAQTARDEVSLEALSGELTRVVQETLQPETVSVWLKTIPQQTTSPSRSIHA